MAQRRDSAYQGLLAQLAPFKWLVGLSFVILIIAVVVLFFLDPAAPKGPKLMVLQASETLVPGQDFRFMHYSKADLDSKLPQEYASMLDSNMSIEAISHIELTDPAKVFTKGYVLRFNRPEGEQTSRALRNLGLKVGVWSFTTQSWEPKDAPIESDDTSPIIYSVTGVREGFYALGYFRNKADDEKSKAGDGKTASEDPKKADGPASNNGEGKKGEVKPSPPVDGLTLRAPVEVRGPDGLRQSRHIFFFLKGLRDASPLRPKCFVGDRVVAEIRGDASKEPLLDGSLKIKWYRTEQDRRDALPEAVNLLNANIWAFDSIPTHRRAEWQINFEIIDVADGRVMAQSSIPLSVLDPSND